jgi:hypothetical protein
VSGPPVFINSRDRLSPLTELVSWLERVGVDEIYIIDNDSAYPPLLEYYSQTPHRVVMLGRNVGKNALWDADGLFDLTRGRAFAYTDSDIVPDPACPLDALDLFLSILERYRDGPLGIHKVGFGIRFDDIPDHYKHKTEALTWERGQYALPLEKNLFYATIDTQFAVYRPNSAVRPHHGARTGWPYVARHHSYYLDLDDLSDEDSYYARRAEAARSELAHFTHWASSELSGSQALPAPPPRLMTRLRWRFRGARALRI